MDRRCSSPPVEPSARRIRPSEPPRQQVLAQRGSAGGGERSQSLFKDRTALSSWTSVVSHAKVDPISGAETSLRVQICHKEAHASQTRSTEPRNHAVSCWPLGLHNGLCGRFGHRPSHRRLMIRSYATRRGGRASAPGRAPSASAVSDPQGRPARSAPLGIEPRVTARRPQGTESPAPGRCASRLQCRCASRKQPSCRLGPTPHSCHGGRGRPGAVGRDLTIDLARRGMGQVFLPTMFDPRLWDAVDSRDSRRIAAYPDTCEALHIPAVDGITR